MSPTRQDKYQPNKWLVRVAIVLLSISFLLLPYLTVAKSLVTNAENTINLLEKSRAFEYTAQIAKSEIQNRLPEKVKQNLIEQSIINRIMDAIITPQLIQNISEPAIKLAIKQLQEDPKLSLENQKIELDVSPYKQNISNYVSSLGLPDGIKESASNFSQSLPDKLAIVDVEKNPNSPLLVLIKLRGLYNNILLANNIAWAVLAISAISLIALLYKNALRLSKLLAKSLIIVGSLVVVFSYLTPPSLSLFVPNNLTESSGSEVAALINSLDAQFFAMTQVYGWSYIAIGLVMTLINWYITCFGFKFDSQEIKHYFKKKFKRTK
ncbi:MAG: hypothetical protein QG675_474 [Patescibacteria group bacterium]|jgi:hypothetical protein|nr:hypothetical protein [Patescibacteria group bacterium]